VTAQTSAGRIVLEPGKRNHAVEEFAVKLRSKIVGQDEAVSQLVNIYEMIVAGMTIPGRPIANLLFLGPTGSGKTRIIEAAAEILCGTPKSFIKIDCGEFQHSHEIAKLIGSPPGYIGHRETPAVLTQEAINQFHTDSLKLTFVLFDEIEKASDAMWQLLLGVLDKGTLTLGDNHKVDLSSTVVVMTSNLGAEQMSRVAHGGIGFTSIVRGDSVRQTDKRMESVALAAARQCFSPEFMNRLDKVVVFHGLSPVQLNEILEIELAQVQDRIRALPAANGVTFKCTPETKVFLIREGTDAKYGARPLKRAIERHLVLPIARLVSTTQIVSGDHVTVDIVPGAGELVFLKEGAGVSVSETQIQDCDEELWECYATAYSANPTLSQN
jgi:ATP-dependent Clp protease ATP-binding subunit ClpB